MLFSFEHPYTFMIYTYFKQFIFSAIIASGLFASSTAFAETGPRETLQHSVESLLTEFTARRAELEQDKAALHTLAERVIDQNWDFSKMAQSVLAKNWRRIEDSQKADFTQAFKGLLIRTYASAMFQYDGKQAIKFSPPVYRDETQKRATVNATGTLGNGAPPIPLLFKMFKDKAGEWRIYDVAIAGVSLVITYRSSYNQIISSKGIDFLIDSLKKKAGA